jgi:hypothetical protein
VIIHAAATAKPLTGVAVREANRRVNLGQRERKSAALTNRKAFPARLAAAAADIRLTA